MEVGFSSFRICWLKHMLSHSHACTLSHTLRCTHTGSHTHTFIHTTLYTNAHSANIVPLIKKKKNVPSGRPFAPVSNESGRGSSLQAPLSILLCLHCLSDADLRTTPWKGGERSAQGCQPVSVSSFYGVCPTWSLSQATSSLVTNKSRGDTKSTIGCLQSGEVWDWQLLLAHALSHDPLFWQPVGDELDGKENWNRWTSLSSHSRSRMMKGWLCWTFLKLNQ